MPDPNPERPADGPVRQPGRKRMTPLRFETAPLPFGSTSISTLIETLLLKARSGQWDSPTCDAYAACLLESSADFGLVELEERILEGFLVAPLDAARRAS
jgi:hypothetical protein